MSRYERGSFPAYVSVAKRRQTSARLVENLKKKGQAINPVVIEGRLIAKTFWGKHWCKNLESYSDYANRLPRGRTYVRNGSVLDLNISAGEITALVSGSSLYKVKIMISKLVDSKWQSLVKECSGKIESLIELLQGKFSKAVMEVITRPEKGLFPHPQDIKLSCSCPDYADMCKHVAAVLYGVGTRLDEQPETLFLLRQTDHRDLLESGEWAHLPGQKRNQGSQKLDVDLSSLFGIDIADSPESIKVSTPKKRISTINSSKNKKKLKPSVSS